jgi:hypothetical protein
MNKITNPKLHELSLKAGGSHYPEINADMQTEFARLIIEACKEAVDNADLRSIVRTTWDQHFAGALKAHVKESIDKTFEVKHD